MRSLVLVLVVAVSGCVSVPEAPTTCLYGHCLEEQSHPEVLRYAKAYGLEVLPFPWSGKSLQELANDYMVIQLDPSEDSDAYTLVAYSLEDGYLHVVTTAEEGSVGYYATDGDFVVYMFRGQKHTIWVENIATGEKEAHPMPFNGRFLTRDFDAPRVVLWHLPGNISQEKYYLYNWETEELQLIKNHSHDPKYRTPEGARPGGGSFDIKGDLVLMPQTWKYTNGTRHNFVDLFNATTGETTRLHSRWTSSMYGYHEALITDDWFIWGENENGPGVWVINRTSGKISSVHMSHSVTQLRELAGNPVATRVDQRTFKTWDSAIFPDLPHAETLVPRLEGNSGAYIVAQLVNDRIHVVVEPHLQDGYTIKYSAYQANLIGPAELLINAFENPPDLGHPSNRGHYPERTRN